MAGTATPSNLKGTTTFFNGEYDAVSVTCTICSALALYNALELLVLVFSTFRRYVGLYFWSLLAASVGVIPYTLGFICEYFHIAPQLVGEIITTFGWPMMVTGQSLVLYSRLGVILGSNYDRLLKAVKWMIIIDGIVFHVSTTVVMFGAYNASQPHNFALAYKYIEKIQMTGFTVQEFIISGLYVWRTAEILKTETGERPGERNRRRRQTMIELVGINAIIYVFDIALLVVEYQNRHVLEQALKALIYSVKLKLEFAVLSKLVEISQRHTRLTEEAFADSTGVDEGRSNSVLSNGTFATSLKHTESKQWAVS